MSFGSSSSAGLNCSATMAFGITYVVSGNNRAKCKDTVCKKEDVKILKALMGFLVCDLRVDNRTLCGQDLGFGADNGHLKGLACY